MENDSAPAARTAAAIQRFYEERNADDLLQFCWRNQDCDRCLGAANFCSWCPFSSTCVANASPFPLLAPLTSEKICPLGPKERWEIRTRPFGCRVSTASFLTSLVSVMSTIALVLIGYAAYQMWVAKKRAEEERQEQEREEQNGHQYGNGPYGSVGGYGGAQYGEGGGFGEGIGGMVVPGVMGAVGGGISNWMGQGQGQTGPETIYEEDEADENSPLL
ncbi:uncharacterized protein GIQ15_05532 [Arthroderma uncinatum]|uniref:uncharacterized protein n=1 Tax=Arthroderma uncinatum TaxID=74035 RepID=UPI00144A7A4B|nr:uncharacterized protein GIQ15_05532 [Arthroderma uncinatum]KAF3480185.1 hypothetical protein GIQ15_05532 [Arthroderma uncinatum]